MPIGIAYAIWSGVGIVLIGIIGLVVFKQSLDFPALLGMGMIIAGVIIINLFSKSVSLKLIPRQFISRSIYICKNNNPPHQMRNSRF